MQLFLYGPEAIPRTTNADFFLVKGCFNPWPGGCHGFCSNTLSSETNGITRPKVTQLTGLQINMCLSKYLGRQNIVQGMWFWVGLVLFFFFCYRMIKIPVTVFYLMNQNLKLFILASLICCYPPSSFWKILAFSLVKFLEEHYFGLLRREAKICKAIFSQMVKGSQL